MLLQGIVYTFFFFFFKEKHVFTASLEAEREFFSGAWSFLLMRFPDWLRCETHLNSSKKTIRVSIVLGTCDPGWIAGRCEIHNRSGIWGLWPFVYIRRYVRHQNIGMRKENKISFLIEYIMLSIGWMVYCFFSFPGIFRLRVDNRMWVPISLV